MRKAMLASVMMLALVGGTPALAYDMGDAPASGFVLTDSHIANLKATLRLSAAQERYWPAVESALRRFSHTASLSSQAAGIKRVLVAASPLIRSLDREQRAEARELARAAGLNMVAAAF